jgi:predicted nucleic acid-binding protein
VTRAPRHPGDVAQRRLAGVLVDTSVWIDHLRRPEPRLIALLDTNDVELHPFVIGELACGQLKRRTEILALLRQLPLVPTVNHEEALGLVEAHRLYGRGVGWIDVHLLASALLFHTRFWTRDGPAAAAARDLGIAFSE